MHRQICCHKTDHRLLYECQHTELTRTKTEKDRGWTYYTYENVMCGNLMHADCIERFGKCHKNSGVRP